MPTNQDERDLTRVLEELQGGRSEAAEELLPLVYEELRSLARVQLARRGPGHTVQATALVHEAWLRLVGRGDPGWQSRAHFFGAASRAIRNILVDQARRRSVRKAGAKGEAESELEELAIEPPMVDVLAVHEALERLEKLHPKMAELVSLRFFGGLNMGEVARIVGEPLRNVERSWALARAWLKREVDLVSEA